MFSKSNQIMSKKEKMNAKRQQKLKTHEYIHKHPASAIQINDDSNSNRSSSSVEVLEAVPSILKEMKEKQYNDVANKNQNNNLRFNKFNLDRLRKLDGPIKSSPNPSILNVQICQDIVVNNIEDMRPINYKKPGSKMSHKTCQNFLKTRLQKIEQQAKINVDQNNVQQNVIINLQKQLQSGEEKVQEAEIVEKQIKIRKIPRYFDDQLSISEQSNQEEEDQQAEKQKSIKCYRCGGRGHIARMCDKQQVIKCMYCLGGHLNNQCPDKICRNCGEKGHIRQDCRTKTNKIRCNKCGKMGHIMKNCGRIVMMNYSNSREKQIRQKYSKEDLQKLKCFKCNGSKDSRGHFNCHQYSKKIPKIYQQTAYLV